MAGIEDLLGPRPPGSIEDLLGPRPPDIDIDMTGEPFDRFFNTTSTSGIQDAPTLATGILDKFAVGAKEGWGTKPFSLMQDVQDFLKESGALKNYKDTEDATTKEAYDGVLRPSVASLALRMASRLPTTLGVSTAVELAMRAPAAIARGLAETEVDETGPLAVAGRVASGLMESLGPEMQMMEPHLYGFNQAHELGITNGRVSMQANEEALRSTLPTGKESATEQVMAPEASFTMEDTPAPPPTNVHDMVRYLEPEVFSEYDWLRNSAEVMNNHARILVDEARRPLENNLNDLLASVDNDESKLDRRQTRQLAALRDQLENFVEPEEATAARVQANKFDAEARDLAPQVSDAYKRANELIPRIEEPPPAVAETANPAAAGVPEFESPSVVNLSQRAPTIAQTVARDLQATGAKTDVARASGALTQAYYETRAARFNGALGSAQDLFDAEAPSIRAGEGGGRGQLSLVNNTLTMFAKADASTYIHESAHGWLEDMMKDAARPEAPPDLVNDLNAVKEWLGQQGERPTRAQHEKFARGFERYMMEGTAPTARLANVFAKFKDWLTKIYQTVRNLKAPITDEIRGVYDRLLSGANTDAIITPDRELPKNFADVHEADVTPTATVEDADRIRTERDQIAQILPAEINNARRRARATAKPPTVEGSTERSGVAPTGAPGTRPAGGAAETTAADTAVSERRVKPETTKPPAAANGDFEPAGTGVTRPDGTPILENISTPADVDDALRSAPGNNGLKGVLTDNQALELAEAGGLDPREVQGNRVAIANSYSAAEIRQLTGMLIDAATDVRDKMVAFANGVGDGLDFAQSIERLRMLQGKAVASGSEWGQAGLALQELKAATGARSVEQLNELLQRTTGRDYDSLMQLAQQAQGLPTPRQVGQMVRQSRPGMSNLGRKVTWWATQAWLSNPFTHSVYFLSNNIRALLLEPAESAVAAGIDTVRAGYRSLRGLPTDTDRVYFRDVGAAIHGVVNGSVAGWRPAYEAYKAGQQPPILSIPMQGAMTTPFGHPSPFDGAVTTAFGQPGKVIAGIHQYSRVQFYTQYLYQYAMREAIQQGGTWQEIAANAVKLQNNADIMLRARDAADTSMFQRRAPWENIVRSDGRIVSQEPAITKFTNWTDSHALAKLAFPFAKVGFEIQRESVRRTPLAFASPEMRGQLLGQEGGASMSTAWGKMLFGHGIVLGGAGLAAGSILTDSGPSDPDTRLVWLQKHQPYSLEIGPLSVPLQGFGPQFNLLLFGADLFGAAHWAKEGELKQLALGYTNAFMHAALDEGFLRSLANLSDVIRDPARHGINFITNLGMGAVPYSAALSSINKEFIDPYTKEARDIFDAIRSRIPLASWSVENQIDRFGNPIRTRGIHFDRYANDPVANWLDREHLGIGKIDRSINGVQLTKEQYNNLEILSGRLTKEYLDNAVASGIENAPRGMQVKMLAHNVEKARKFARHSITTDSLGTDNDIAAQAADIRLKAIQ